ncbi:MAG: response regulator [Deltaproteobacteria bacterium]|nr:response regulator [Deltaproteobacteria bacterium]
MSTVLVVEDEEQIQRLIRIILEKKGHKVLTASTGESALEQLDSGIRPHLILLDIMMPGIDGLKVLGKLKQNQSMQDIPVILLSALAKENIVIQGIKLGAKGYIRKPFHPRDLVERVSPFLEEN